MVTACSSSVKTWHKAIKINESLDMLISFFFLVQKANEVELEPSFTLSIMVSFKVNQ